MTDREMVMQHFQDAIEASGNNNKWRFVRLDIIEKAITLLKEQETNDTRESRIFQCKECGYGIEDIFLNSEHDYPIIPIYCPNCGRKVKHE